MLIIFLLLMLLLTLMLSIQRPSRDKLLIHQKVNDDAQQTYEKIYEKNNSGESAHARPGYIALCALNIIGSKILITRNAFAP